MCESPLFSTEASLHELLHASVGDVIVTQVLNTYDHKGIKKFKTIFIFKFIQFFTRLLKK
jgi:hypothetical protein